MLVIFIFTTLTSLIKHVADVNDQLPAITFWLMGSFANTEFADFWLILPPIAAGIIGHLLLRWQLNIRSLGEEEAYSPGFRTAIGR